MQLCRKRGDRLNGTIRALGFGIALTLCLGAAAQTQPQKQQPAPQQPSQGLSVDFDPVPSPDPDVAAPAAPQTGQQAAGEINRQGGKFQLSVVNFEVQLNASVFDSSGRRVDDLPQDAFKVYEDGVLQKISSFRHEDLPVSLGILIDSSGSMLEKKQAVDAASIKLVRLSNPKDEAFLVDFNSEAYIDQDFTSDVTKLQQGLELAKVGGGTALYDAVVAAADYLSKNAKQPKQVLLVVTDGEDNASSAQLEQAIERVQDLDGPVIYTIGLLFGPDSDRHENRRASSVLKELSEQTGGEAYFPKSLKEVDGIAEEVARDIRTQYTIGYHPAKSPELGGYRQVHVEAKGKGFGKLQVRTRAGYFPKTAGSKKASDGETPPAQ